MSLAVGKLTKIKSRYKVVADWQTETNEHKLVSCWYRNYYSKQKPLPSKVGLILFAYLYIYKSKFSTIYKGKHINIISESDDCKEFQVLNISNANPNDYDFRGQLIRMELPIITYHNHLSFEVYFEKIVSKQNENMMIKKPEYKENDDVFIKGSVVERAENNNNDGLVRIKITNFAKFISMNMESNDNIKSLIIELKKSEILNKNDILLLKQENEDDDKSDFETDNEEEIESNTYRIDSDYDSSDPRYNGFDIGDPFISGEYYFIGIISNKVDRFDTDTNNYHLDGYGIDSATDYVYFGEGNNVIDTEELNEPWNKPSILNLDKVKVECNMIKKTLTFYKNGKKFGPKNKNYTISFDHYGVNNKEWFPAVCIVNKNVKAVFKYL